MYVTRKLLRYAAVPAALLSSLPAQAQTRDHAPVSLQSARRMAQDAPGSESWTYAKPIGVFQKYRSLIVDPTTT